MKSYKHIILIGMPGSGKSSIASKLAQSLLIGYEDTDKKIEKTQRMSIAQIFAIKGEEFFRDAETEILHSILKAAMSGTNADKRLNDNISPPLSVVATGGGSILRAENRDLICNGNLVVYLKLSIDSLMKNLAKSSHRPLLESATKGEAENKRNKITKLLAQRGDLYEKSADIIIEADGLNLAEIIEKIISQINLIKG